ncbi:MAG: hemoglobin/transferrin/lactoferrin receptor protein [Arenicella sp.]|jgi:hemoglobin/transferrin/lactoferrin receptor protein
MSNPITTMTSNTRLIKTPMAKSFLSGRIKKVPSFAVFIGLSLLSTGALAEKQPTGKIEEIIISSTRTEKLTSEVANTVSVIDAAQIQREIANNIDDLVRYEPGVSVGGGGRFGLSSFSIRGVGGDRVLTLVDSTPTADEFSFGPFLSSRRDFVDIDALKAVEIVRGPGSSVYGSNAIGGVVNFITKEPIDYLGDRNLAGSAKVSYSSVDKSINTTVLAAFGNQTWSGMVVGTRREGSETETFFGDNTVGSARRAQNPQEAENNNIYAKLVYAPSDSQSVTLVTEKFQGDAETKVLTAVGGVSRGVLTNSEIGTDQRTRERLSLDYRLNTDSVLFETISMLAYFQNSDAEQNTVAERLSRGALQERTRGSFYEQENVGIRVQMTKAFEIGRVEHELIYGIDYDQSQTTTLREGKTVDRANGAQLPEFTNFPTRDFPTSEYTSVGAFIQDDISLLEGRLHIIPALRYDSFELQPTVDAIYLSGNTGSPTPEGYDKSQLSFKIGVVYDFNDRWSMFAQYAEGFRAPPLDAVNSGFTNFIGGYTTLPNPDLLPEQGESVEIGIRRYSDAGSVEFTVYQNTYEDFIETLAVRGFNLDTRLLEFQARNLDQAEISGFEFKTQYNLGQVYSDFDGFHLRAAYAYSDGENQQDGTPLNSIDPQQLVVGVGYAPADDKWSIEAVVVATDSKSSSDIDASSLQAQGAPSVMPFEASSFVTLDLIGHYNINDNARINWGVFNVTDKQHFQWSEEFVQNPATTNFDRLTEPGRNYSITVKVNF